MFFFDRSRMLVTVFNGRGYIVYASIYGEPEMSKKKIKRTQEVHEFRWTVHISKTVAADHKW